MSEVKEPLSLDDAAQSLTVLAARLEEFVAAWEATGDPPELRAFLPDAGELRRMTLVELIKVDLEYRWLKHTLPRRIEEYLAEFPELRDGGVPADLLYEEFHVRRQAGFAVSSQEYLDEFPDQAAELRCLLGMNQPYESTALYKDDPRRLLEAVQVGERVDDFDLLAKLGQGAFAHVFLARQCSMQRLVALKMSADHGAEPQTLAQLDHDNIVRVFDQRVVPEQGLRMLYMQYLPGGTLENVVKELRQTPASEQAGSIVVRSVDRSLEQRGEERPSESTLRAKLKTADWADTVCWIGSRLARGLDYAHRRGVLHRDIKPANVLLTAEGVPKLADFNISFSSKLDGATPAAYFGGSLAYMSPEQLEACCPAHARQPNELDGRSDLYSLGVLLWELLTGQRPFADEKVEGGWTKTLEAMIGRRRTGADDSALAAFPAGYPAGLIAVLKTCLAADPHDRWQTGAELAQQLELCRKPRARRILHPPERSLAQRLRRRALPVVLLAALIPNVLTGVFSFVYNDGMIMGYLPLASQRAFRQIVLAINSVAYPLGLLLIAVLVVSITRVVRSDPTRRGSVPERLTVRDPPGTTNSADPISGVTTNGRGAARIRSLRLGHYCALIAVSLWVVAGIAYPVSIHLVSGVMPWSAYAHFFGSLLLCGLVSAAYPFFGVTYFAVRVLYPTLLPVDFSGIDDSRPLNWLKSLSARYLAIAASVPMLAIVAVLVFGRRDTPVERFALIIVAAAGFVGFILVYEVYRQLQADLEALVDAVSDQS